MAALELRKTAGEPYVSLKTGKGTELPATFAQFVSSSILSVLFVLLTVSGQGKILSYVQEATPGTGVAQRYLELGGK